jgi:DNA-3-methyladenine glycosylase
MIKKLNKGFFARSADVVARNLLGKILCRKREDKILKARIVETEAYFGEDDPASRASKGKNKISEMMWESPGKILVYNVHKYKMLNFVTGKKGEPSAVLIRALEPLNFKGRCFGPGLLTCCLEIAKQLHGKSVFGFNEIWIEDDKESIKIKKTKRIGVSKDLEIPLRFYIKGNQFISRK